MIKPDFETAPRILVADDDRDVADVFCILLSAAGYRVQRAYDGLTALSLAKVTRPDAAVLNLAMPGMTGLQILRELREAGVPVPAIITTGTAAFGAAVLRSVEEGAQACLQKPCPADRLLGAVAGVLAQARRPDGAAPGAPPHTKPS